MLFASRSPNFAVVIAAATCRYLRFKHCKKLFVGTKSFLQFIVAYLSVRAGEGTITSVPDVMSNQKGNTTTMVSTTDVAQLFVLGDLADARGKLGPAHSKATQPQMSAATAVVTDANSYSSHLGECVICVEDRLHRDNPRLAGGALSLALMHNFVFTGAHLSDNLRELKAQDMRLALHEDCGALKLVAGLVIDELSSTNARGYALLGAMGVDVPAEIRRRIADWAHTFPRDYVDIDEALKIVHEVDPVSGEHNAVFAAVSREDGASFTGGPRLKRETNGLLAFAFDPWVARREAQRIAINRDDAIAAEMLALVFAAQVFLTLGGPDLRIAIHG